jgi:UDP-N-acetylglucosamine--N-acetylmuramyl-(pentapeptide) pyrophosphoryl-undecaprenol N-acetylglucosamine transferase
VRVLFSGGGTGGHLYPGLAIARALVKVRTDVEPHFVGAKRGIERDVLPRTEFPYTLLDVYPIARSKPWQNWRAIRGLVGGWQRVSELSRQEWPALVVGTGGYASAVALLWARANGVTIVQHIGDTFPGMAARSLARLSRECYLGFPEAEEHLPKGNTRYIVTGNPIEPPPEPRPRRSALMQRWSFDPDSRVLLVFGGSQGSLALNEAVDGFIRGGVPDGWSVIWATGKSTHARFKSHEAPRVRVTEYLSPIADAYAVADLALVRGGMMGTAELCAWGVPMIIVPLPTAAADHQTWNARALEQSGAAIHLPQRDLTVDTLRTALTSLASDPARPSARAEGALRRPRPDAAREIAEHISQLLGAGHGVKGTPR